MDNQWISKYFVNFWAWTYTEHQWFLGFKHPQSHSWKITTVCPYFSEKTWIRISYFLNRFLWTIIISTEGNSWIRITSVEKNCRTKSLIIMDGQDNKIIGLAYSEFKSRKSPCPKPRKCRELILHPANENLLTPNKMRGASYLEVKTSTCGSLTEVGFPLTPKEWNTGIITCGGPQRFWIYFAEQSHFHFPETLKINLTPCNRYCSSSMVKRLLVISVNMCAAMSWPFATSQM